ncbi:helix-turn-helix domain-containing protein [Knoellia koreensis]|uniref:Helix-turn-helix transcriptional regulator n=1 Tax=Knoellia koreensis TaxID=2730921 RepID=A0A849HH13_9MICO|nr:helix-turn-helix transcriptional regulator [Knoellia sp. DB2414S]NNM45864.1 helix-turn-helix transcriptional regulator [Knoellia sp. DB2414S]
MAVVDETSGRSAFADDLRQAVANKGLSLHEVQARLAESRVTVSTATLSYWATGRSQPQRAESFEALAVLERLLDLPAGRLVDHFVPPANDALAGLVTCADLPSPCTVQAAVLAELGCAPPLHAVEEVVHLAVDVDGSGATRAITARRVIRALRDGVRHVPVLALVNPSDDDARPSVAKVSGCTVGRTACRPDEGVFGAELLLDHPLGEGERTVIEHEIVYPSQLSAGHYHEYHARGRVNAALVWVRFDPAHPPRAIQSYQRTIDGTVILDGWLEDGSPSAHVFEHRFGPGTLGIRWEMGDVSEVDRDE